MTVQPGGIHYIIYIVHFKHGSHIVANTMLTNFDDNNCYIQMVSLFVSGVINIMDEVTMSDHSFNYMC